MLPGSTWREETSTEGEQPEPPRQPSTSRDHGLAPRWSPQHKSAGGGWGCWGQAKSSLPSGTAGTTPHRAGRAERSRPGSSAEQNTMPTATGLLESKGPQLASPHRDGGKIQNNEYTETFPTLLCSLLQQPEGEG